MKTAWIAPLLMLAVFGPVRAAELPALDMKSVQEISPELVTGSQPSRADMEKLKAAGVSTIINLRGAGEDAGFDEAASARELGLNYVTIPIAGADDVTVGNAAKLDSAMRKADGKTLVHCASGNRAGALLALRAAASGQSVDDAIEFGKSAGMTSLEKVVRERLSTPTTQH
ncbi:hypothetical protein HPT27_04770 [Permianibacter sp. IMCC34836]|uniref:beta-lactamase hydrolase domain-containing protein n=1 Tax=Permianibacter fluminis TaxID=2738515 RepID=UPI001553A4A3|nr:sulfur transferase domain-containing protein [Permianibacter fluminis]NQD36329.1 hypothetical protein [Permianibacter fluminis]